MLSGIPRLQPGDPITAEYLNQLAAGVEAARNISGPNVVRSSTGTHIRPEVQRPGDTRIVICKQTGGSAGSLTTPCTYTYSISTPGDTAFAAPLATAVEVVFGRTRIGAYTRPLDGSIGLAFQQTVGAQTLWRLLLVGRKGDGSANDYGEVPLIGGNCNCV